MTVFACFTYLLAYKARQAGAALPADDKHSLPQTYLRDTRVQSEIHSLANIAAASGQVHRTLSLFEQRFVFAILPS